MAYPFYVPYFHQILLDTGKVYVEGLGTFLLNRTSSTFGKNKALILPPSSSVTFKNGVYDGLSLSVALNESGVDSDLANKIEHSFANDYKDSVANNLPFHIRPLVTIENGVLVNVNSSFFNKYEGLLDISTSVLGHDVQRAYVQKTKMAFEPIQLKPSAPYKSSWKDYLIPLLIIFSLVSIITIWYDSSKMLIPVSQMQSQYAVKPTKVKAAIQSKSSNQMMSEVDSILNEQKQSKAPVKVTTPSIKKIITAKSSDSKLSIKTKVTKKIIGSAAVNKNGPIAENDRSCVIIVGSFKNNTNATRLVKKLSQKGYQTYTENNRGLHRVGVTYNCTEKDTEVFKNEIRQSLNPDAWKLKDTI